MPQAERPSAEDLELPPLDGGAEEDAAIEPEDDVAVRDEDDPYDDSTGKDDDFTSPLDHGDEPSALGDDDLGVAMADDEVPDELESESMLGDEDAPGVAGEDFGLVDGGDGVRDAGEEGFDAPEPELRVEDLPRLDDGDDDDLSLEEAIEVPASIELRWDDRVFERIARRPIGHVARIRVRGGIIEPRTPARSGGPRFGLAIEATLEDGSVLRSVDGGETFITADHDADEEDEALVSRGRARALLRDGIGILRAIDDGPLTLVESTAEATAFTLLDDGSLIAALDTPDRTRLVRIAVDGTATVVAEEESTIEALALDPRTGVVWAGGAFGLVAYR